MSGYSPETLRARPNGAVASPAPTACPKLGLTDDRASRAMFAVPQHRCFASAQPGEIPAEHQLRFCLSARHRDCPVFLGQPPPWRHRFPLSARPLGDGRRIRPSRAWLGRWPLAAIGLFVGVIVVAGAVALARPRHANPPSTAGNLAIVQPSPALVVASVSPIIAATQAPVSATPTAAPAAASPAPATAVATPGTSRYTVQPGEGLSGLAERFGVSLAALASANNLSTTASLDIGQVLVIPASRATATPASSR